MNKHQLEAPKGNILIVDDTPENLDLLVGILAEQDYTVRPAPDGKFALDFARTSLPDLILLDIKMPGLDGYEVCERLKADKRTQDIPVLFISALNEVFDKVKAFELGGVDYISKPFQAEEVLARVKTHLQNQRLQKDLRTKNAELLKKQHTLDQDLFAAAQIQQSLIPDVPPTLEHFRFAWQFIPCIQIGGDIFNIHPLDDVHLGIYMLDVSGHGVPSAMVTVSVSQMLVSKTSSILTKPLDDPPYYEIVSPIEVLKCLDHNYPLERFGKYFTMNYLILNTQTGKIQYSNAAHPMPVLLRASGELELLEAGGPAIGMGQLAPFEERSMTMEPGDRLFLYTDGIVEFANQQNEFYGEDRFYRDILNVQAQALENACHALIESVMAYGDGIPPQDDMTLLAIERTQD